MADAGVVEQTSDVAPDVSDGRAAGVDVPPADSAEPSVADAMRGGVDDPDGGAPGEEPAGGGDVAQAGDVAGGPDADSGESPSGVELPRESTPAAEQGSGTGLDEQLTVRNPGSQAAPPEPNPENLRQIRAVSKRQAEDTREDASEKAAEVVRTEDRRILGLDGKPDFEAESVSHVMGLARDGERVDPELEKELRAELDALGVNLDGVKLRYESMSKEDRRQLTTFEVQQAFLRVVERVDHLATQASVSLGHRIRMFDGEARDQLKLVAGLRVLIETEQGKVEDLAVGFRKRMQEETDGFEEVVGEQKKLLTDKVKGVEAAFGEVGGHLKSCEDRAQRITEQLASVGLAATHAEQEALRVMSELQRVANSGLAVRRLALLGGVIGSAVGGFVAFVVLLLLWAVTSG